MYAALGDSTILDKVHYQRSQNGKQNMYVFVYIKIFSNAFVLYVTICKIVINIELATQ